MSSSDGLRIDLIAAVFLLITKGAVVLGQAAGPNAVVSMNGQATLDCVVVQMAYTQWSRTLDGSSNPSTIAFGCSVIGSNSDYYSTEQPGGNVCRLIIGNATMQQAGVYSCYDGSSITFRSLVTAIDPVANVVVYNQSEIVEDDHLNISCSVNYTGSSSPAPSIRPSPYFTSQGQSFTSLTYYPSANIVTVVATVQVQKPKVPIFWCNTVFEITGNTTGYNSTPPADNRTLGATTELDVEYCPGNISTTTTVSTADNCVYRKENLTCTADAYPEAQYEWLDLKNNSKTSGPVKSIEYGGKYQCIASNTIRSQPCSITANVTEYDCYAVMNMKITGPDCSNGSCNCTGKESIELVCLADSLPMPTYRWWSHVTQNNHQNISVTVDGNYSCIANNSFGSNSSEGIASISVVNCPEPPTTTTRSTTTKNIESTTTGSNSTSTRPNKMSTGHIAGIVIGCLLGINILMTCFFIGYYTILETSAAMTGRNGNVKTGRNKIRLNKRFPWLQKMLPCLNDTKDAAGSNFPWVFLFTLLATLTGIITFPVWIALSIKSETNNEMSVLNKRDDEANENTGNGSPTYTPVGKRTKASHLEGPYQNSAGDIELNSSLHSRNHRPTDSPTLNASIRGKPPPPPKNKPTVNSPNRSMECPINGSAALNYLEPTTYAELPINIGNTPSPVQLLVPDDPSDNYAVLNKT